MQDTLAEFQKAYQKTANKAADPVKPTPQPPKPKAATKAPAAETCNDKIAKVKKEYEGKLDKAKKVVETAKREEAKAEKQAKNAQKVAETAKRNEVKAEKKVKAAEKKVEDKQAAKPKSTAKPKAEPKPKAIAKPKAEPKSKAVAKPKAAPKPKAVAKPKKKKEGPTAEQKREKAFRSRLSNLKAKNRKSERVFIVASDFKESLMDMITSKMKASTTLGKLPNELVLEMNRELKLESLYRRFAKRDVSFFEGLLKRLEKGNQLPPKLQQQYLETISTLSGIKKATVQKAKATKASKKGVFARLKNWMNR
jgi:hypothetical protein